MPNATAINRFPLIKTQAYIGGEYLDADSGKTFEVRNPADNQLICRVADLGQAETERAIIVAEQAQQLWQKRLPKERAQILRAWHDLVLAHQQELAQILSLEQGKPLAESRGEILYGAAFIEYYAEEAKRICGEILPSDKENHRLMVIKQPIGVVAAITPWNFPNAMIARKAAPALAAGCSLVIKPSEETPLSALALAELATQAGLPKGLLNIVTSKDAETVGKVLSESPIVRKLSFTGSTRVGKILMAQSAPTVKKISVRTRRQCTSYCF